MNRTKLYGVKKVLTIAGLGAAMLLAVQPFRVSAKASSQSAKTLQERTIAQEGETLQAGEITQEVETLQAGMVAQGVDQDCKWQIDQKGQLTIRSIGKNANLSNEAWWQYKDQIKSVDIDVPYSNHLSEMFLEFPNLEKARVKIDKCKGSTERMFEDCSKLLSIDLSGWDASELWSTSCMFRNCISVRELKLSNWKTAALEDMSCMFSGCLSLKELDLTCFQTGKVTDMSCMFNDCYELSSLKLGNWDTSNVEKMEWMFFSCYKLNSLDLSSFRTDKVKDMSYMFCRCQALKALNISGFCTANVEKMIGMFQECYRLRQLNLSGFTTTKVKEMGYMFDHCSALQELDLRSFRTPALVDMRCMFSYCKGLKKIDISNFELENAVGSAEWSDKTQADKLFDGCDSLVYILAPKHLTRKFCMPDNGTWYRDDTKVKIMVLPKKLTQSIVLHRQEKGNKLYDVRTDSWQHENVEYAVEKKLMNGKETTKDGLICFDPDTNMTRAEFVQTLYNYKGTPTVKYKNVFKDVPKGKWFTNSVIWAYNEKLVSGIGDKTFGVDEKITRQDMITILYKYAEKCDKKLVSNATKFKLTGFTDYKTVSNYAVTPLKWATGNYVINGKPEFKDETIVSYKIAPKDTATRAECAAIWRNYLTFVSKQKK